jgi:hypothetical protein
VHFLTTKVLRMHRLASDLQKVEEMRNVVSAVWSMFDPDGSNSIGMAHFPSTACMSPAVMLRATLMMPTTTTT